MIRHGAGLGNQLKAVVQRAVMLSIEQLMVFVGNGQELFRICRKFAAFIDLQLDSEIPGTISIENRLRLVVVLVDSLVAGMFGVAVAAIGGFLVVLQVIGIPVGKKHTAFRTGHILVFIAVMAEDDAVISLRLVPPDPVSAVITEGGFLIQTGRAQLLAVKEGTVFHRMLGTAAGADKGIRHIQSPFSVFVGEQHGDVIVVFNDVDFGRKRGHTADSVYPLIFRDFLFMEDLQMVFLRGNLEDLEPVPLPPGNGIIKLPQG